MTRMYTLQHNAKHCTQQDRGVCLIADCPHHTTSELLRAMLRTILEWTQGATYKLHAMLYSVSGP